MELRHLRYFLAVAEEQSFTRAAARLHVSQPTLSQQIRALEKSIGGPLFQRGPRGARLTAAGLALLDPAQTALAGVAEGLQAARDAARPGPEVLRVGFVYGAAGRLTQPMLTAFRRAFPQVRLACREMTTGQLNAGLLEDQIDLAITRLPLDPERQVWTVLFEEPRILGVNARHPLADAVEVPVDDVLGAPMPCYDTRTFAPYIQGYWQLWEHRDGQPTQPTDPVGSVLEIAVAIMHNPAVVAVGLEFLRTVPPLPGCTLRFLALRDLPLNVAVVARRRRDCRPLVRAFCDIAGTVARQLGSLPRPGCAGLGDHVTSPGLR